jgi:hypothetical protein
MVVPLDNRRALVCRSNGMSCVVVVVVVCCGEELCVCFKRLFVFE